MESKKKLKNHFRNIFKNQFVMFILCSKNKLNLGELPSKQSHFIFSFPTIKLEKAYVYTGECQNSNFVSLQMYRERLFCSELHGVPFIKATLKSDKKLLGSHHIFLVNICSVLF